MKKRKSSMRARGSPRHARRPVGRHGGSVSLGSTPPRSPQGGQANRAPPSPKVPAEKGMKASCLTKRPRASRKCSGWKRKGFSQTVSSFSTDDRLVMSVVPWWQMSGMGEVSIGGGGGGCPDPCHQTHVGAHTCLAHTWTQVTAAQRFLSTVPVPMAGVLTAPLHGLRQYCDMV